MSQIRDKELVVAYCASNYITENPDTSFDIHNLCDLFMSYVVEDDHITALRMERDNEPD